MLVYIQSSIAIILGIIATISDLKNKKIYNKNIIIAVLFSLAFYGIFYKQIKIEYLRGFLINILISFLISFSFFYFKIWAAGDAKLFLAIVLMIPFEVYNTDFKNLFPAVEILILIFGVAFIYVFFETLILWIKDKDKFRKKEFKKYDTRKIIDLILQLLMGYSLIMCINNYIFNYFDELREYNQILLMICNMLILLFVYKIIKSKKEKICILLITFFANLVYYFIFGFSLYGLNLEMLVIVLIVLIFKDIAEKYNYEEISVDDLKPRMILSYGSVFKFYNSKVKGLPKFTNETTDSRITEEQVNSIKRWSKTKKGDKTIVIVRHMPFAPFVLVGELIFFILKIYIN